VQDAGEEVAVVFQALDDVGHLEHEHAQGRTFARTE
jgi:hypothetical protein